MHEGENAVVVGRCRKDQSVIAERVLNSFRHIVSCQVADGDLNALRTQKLGELLGSDLGVAVNGCVSDADAGLLGCVGGPLVIHAKVISEIFAQNRTVERADDLNVKSGCSLKELLCLKSVFAHDAKIVSARFASPSFRIFHIVGAEFSEAVSGEEDLVSAVVCHHDFRPVYHRREHKFKNVFAEAEFLAVLDDLLLHGRILAIELLHESECFGISNDYSVRISAQEACDIGGVIGLHMLHDEVIRLSVAKDSCKVCKPLLAEVLVYGIHDCDLLIHDHIRVVGHSSGNDVLSLEQVYLMVIYANIFDIICYSHIPLLYTLLFIITVTNQQPGIQDPGC